MIVVFAGEAGVGKDTCSDYLVATRGFVKIALADPLKRMCKEIYDFTDTQLWGPSRYRNEPDVRFPRESHVTFTPEDTNCACCGASLVGGSPTCYLTPRYALQTLGTDWGRHCHPLTWVRIAIKTARKVLGSTVFAYSARYGLEAVEHVRQPVRGVVISDGRFPNEINGFLAENAEVCRIDRELPTRHFSSHLSETSLASVPSEAFTHVIKNDDTIVALHQKLETLWP